MPTLLIADDSMFQRFMVGKAVKAAGFQVREARSGQECLDEIRRHPPDGILLDLNMPDGKGLDVLEILQAEGRRIPVVVLTADIQETVRRRCAELGAALFLNKPIDEGVLVDALQAIFSPGPTS